MCVCVCVCTAKDSTSSASNTLFGVWFALLKKKKVHWINDRYNVVIRYKVAVAESLNHIRLFFNLMDCSPPGSSVHGIFQERILEWVAISFSIYCYKGLNVCILPKFLC